MSVKHSLLALLSQGPRYGYQLRQEFEESTGGAWPLNIGQVYTTLDRLSEQGLVQDLGVDDNGQRDYEITDSGREEMHSWFSTPVHEQTPRRDEVVIKLALAVTTPGVDVVNVIQQQRAATLRLLQAYTQAKRTSQEDESSDLAGILVIEALIFQAEAMVRWLDHCEGQVLRAAAQGQRRGSVRSVSDKNLQAEQVRHD